MYPEGWRQASRAHLDPIENLSRKNPGLNTPGKVQHLGVVSQCSVDTLSTQHPGLLATASPVYKWQHSPEHQQSHLMTPGRASPSVSPHAERSYLPGFAKSEAKCQLLSGSSKKNLPQCSQVITTFGSSESEDGGSTCHADHEPAHSPSRTFPVAPTHRGRGSHCHTTNLSAI